MTTEPRKTPRMTADDPALVRIAAHMRAGLAKAVDAGEWPPADETKPKREPPFTKDDPDLIAVAKIFRRAHARRLAAERAAGAADKRA